MVHGLWVGPSASTQDFLTVMYRIQALGFNAVRLPMSFQVGSSSTVLGGSFRGLCVPNQHALMSHSMVARMTSPEYLPRIAVNEHHARELLV